MSTNPKKKRTRPGGDEEHRLKTQRPNTQSTGVPYKESLRLLVTRIDEYAGPAVTSGILRVPKSYDELEALLRKEGGHLSLKIDDGTWYDTVDMFEMCYEAPEVDSVELYQLLCSKELEEVGCME